MSAPARTEPLRLGTIKDAAALGSCSEITIRRRIRDGEIRAYRFGPRMVRVALDDVEFMLEPLDPCTQDASTTGGTP